MGMKFLNKKTWHPATFANQERVWKAEQKHKEEEKKMAELQKQVREEREREEFRQLQIRAGVLPQQERLDFLYESGLGVGKPSEAPAAPSAQEYLLGKPVQDASRSEPASKDFSQPGALFQQADDPASKNDAWRKLHSDPLLAIRQQEQAALAKIKENPVQMMMLKQQAAEKKAQRKEEKRRAKEERRAERKRKREERKKRKREDSSESESDTESEDEKPAKPPLERNETPRKEEPSKDRENLERNGHYHGEVTRGERDGERGPESRGERRAQRFDHRDRDRGRLPVPGRHESRGEGYHRREEGYHRRESDYGDRRPDVRYERRVSPRPRKEEPERVYTGRHYSPERHRRSPERHQRSPERHRNGGAQSRGERSPQRDDWERREGARGTVQKRHRHDSSDEETEVGRGVTRRGEEQGREGERRVERNETRDEKDRRRHDTPDSDENEGDRGGDGQKVTEVGEKVGRNGHERTEGVFGEITRPEPKNENRVNSEEASEEKEGAGEPVTGPVTSGVKVEEEGSDDEPGKLKGYGLIAGRGGLQLPAKRPGDAPPVPYKKPEEPAKPAPRVRHVPGKLTEEEKARRLAEMQQDADVHESSRVHRLKRAAEKEEREDAAAAKSAVGKNYLGRLEKSAYGLDKAGSVEDSIRRRTHFREKGPTASHANAFRR